MLWCSYVPLSKTMPHEHVKSLYEVIGKYLGTVFSKCYSKKANSVFLFMKYFQLQISTHLLL